jgi:hypothetical protein
VQDRRLAITKKWIDDDCMPTGENGRGAPEVLFGLRHFFICGGLECIDELAGWGLPIRKIKEKSNEGYTEG